MVATVDKAEQVVVVVVVPVEYHLASFTASEPQSLIQAIALRLGYPVRAVQGVLEAIREARV